VNRLPRAENRPDSRSAHAPRASLAPLGAGDNSVSMTVSPIPYPLGRLSRGHDARVPHLSALIAGQRPPPPPPAIDYTRIGIEQMPAELGAMLTDRLAIATCAAYYHAVQVWSFNAKNGDIDFEPDSNVERLYIEACGYEPQAGDAGPGGTAQAVLTYLVQAGAPTGFRGQHRRPVLAFVEVDPRNIDDVKRTIADCGLAYVGLKVPASLAADPPLVWDVRRDDTRIVGGHAVVLAGYDARGAKVISWGRQYMMTWRFFAEYVDEVYAIADPDWIDAGGGTPGGLSIAELQALMRPLRE